MSVRKRTLTTYIGEDEHAGFEFTHEPFESTLTIEKTKTGYTARYLVRDDNPISPDEDGDDALFLVGYRRDFTVDGPRVYHKLPDGVKRDPADKGHLKVDREEARAIMRGGKYEDDSIHEAARDLMKEYHIFGLEAYIHSGVTLALLHEGNFCDRQWDVSQLGLVFVSKKEWHSREKARATALSLIASWNAYLSWDMYGCVREEYGADKKQISEDSCWGFSGYEYAIEELKNF
jgi:hypothetical protein